MEALFCAFGRIGVPATIQWKKQSGLQGEWKKAARPLWEGRAKRWPTRNRTVLLCCYSGGAAP